MLISHRKLFETARDFAGSGPQALEFKAMCQWILDLDEGGSAQWAGSKGSLTQFAAGCRRLWSLDLTLFDFVLQCATQAREACSKDDVDEVEVCNRIDDDLAPVIRGRFEKLVLENLLPQAVLEGLSLERASKLQTQFKYKADVLQRRADQALQTADLLSFVIEAVRKPPSQS